MANGIAKTRAERVQIAQQHIVYQVAILALDYYVAQDIFRLLDDRSTCKEFSTLVDERLREVNARK